MHLPLNPSFHFNYANALMYAGENDAAEDELETVIALNPDHVLAHFMLSRVHRQTKIHKIYRLCTSFPPRIWLERVTAKLHVARLQNGYIYQNAGRVHYVNERDADRKVMDQALFS